ncbi:hypothetical protein D6779_07825 [Candidatus Parcubacteria bacterium]|nr:MAG: hypothetical protein D6779_07825 [Candidatus Parcubacteria bacterium]
MDFFKFISEVMTKEITPYLWSAVIVLLAAWKYFDLKKHVENVRRELNKSVDLIKELKTRSDNPCEVFESINEKLEKSKLIGHQWKEFYETLIFEDQDGVVRIRNSYNAEDFFSPSYLLGAKINLRFYKSMPNFLTGLGILGTFMGLAAGIYLAGINLSSPDQANQALKNLLQGASLAFITSIVGLFLSMVFSGMEKKLMSGFEEAREKWVTELDGYLNRVTTEQISKDLLEESRQQTSYFSQFAEQVVFQLTEALEKTMPKALDENVTAPLTKALDALQSSVEDLARNQQRTNEDTLHQIVEKFSETITGAAGKEMQEFASTVKALSEQVDNQIKQIVKQQEEVHKQTESSVTALAETFEKGSKDLQEKVGESVNQILSGLSLTVEKMSSVLNESTANISRELNETSTVFKEAVGGLTGSIKDVRSILTDTKDMVEYLDQVVASVRRAHTGLENVVNSIDSASQSIRAVAEENKQVAIVSQQGMSQLTNALEDFSRQQEVMESAWAQYESRFKHLDRSLAEAFQQIEQGLEKYTQMVNDFITSLDGHTGNITSKLAGSVEELNESIEELNESIERLVKP